MSRPSVPALLAVLVLGVTAASPVIQPSRREAVAVFAGGCFWGIEGVFEHVRGVKSATSGYAGGSVDQPSYAGVSSGTTGHAESVKVVYDPGEISYRKLLEIFFLVAHNPTELNRQGPDVGTQYRSIAFYGDAGEQKQLVAYIAELNASHRFGSPIVTQVLPLKTFYPAEDYHQGYMRLHPNQPYIVYNDAPKVARLQQQYPTLYREAAAE